MATVNEEYLDKVKKFGNDMFDVLCDRDTPSATKQSYFINNYQTAHEYINTLSQYLKDMGENNLADVDTDIMNRATTIVQYLQKSIAQFKQEMTINPDVQVNDTVENIDVDVTKAVLESRITDGELPDVFPLVQSQLLPEDVSAFTHLFCENDNIHFITAKDYKDLENQINSLVESKQLDGVKLYSLSLTEIPLQYKMVLGI